MHEHDVQLVLQTVAIALSVGVLLIAVAKRLGAPSILLLLAGGVALGPMGLAVVQPHSLGDGLRVIVSLLVGVILFEGGLTLDLAGYRRGSRVIKLLLTVGAAVTWLGTAAALWALTGFGFAHCVVIASLVIVTGPTVIGPLLKRVRVNERLHHILQWEGVLIDPVGVFIAVLCFEALALGRGGDALLDFALRIGTGLGLGVVGGIILSAALRRRWIPTEMGGAGTLAGAVAIFAAAETTAAEAGLLAVTVAGLWVGWRRPVDLTGIRHFKGEITEIAIGVLFIVLSARLDPRQFLELGVPGLLAVAAVMLMVRPAAVWLCTLGSQLSMRERAFLGWVAPRGIVAASMASLFAIELEVMGHAQPRFVESFTYAVIIATIVFQASTAKGVARRLGVLQAHRSGWLVVGANGFGRAFAHMLITRDLPYLLVDTNRALVERARQEGLRVVHADAFDVEAIRREPAMAELGHLFATTANHELNQRLLEAWSSTLDPTQRHASLPGKDGVALRPATIAYELERGTARLVSGPRPSEDAVALASLDADGFMTGPTVDGLGALWLVRNGSLFAQALMDEVTLQPSPGATATGVVQQMLELVGSGVSLPPAVVKAATDALRHRDAATGTLLGRGIAVPHLFLPGIERPHCIMARLDTPTVWVEGEPPVDLVVLLLSPADDESAHLALLADMARHFIANDPQRHDLTAA